MGAFICQISETDWELARSIGVYGNRENKPDGSGPLRPQDRLSIIRDLISARPEDTLYFHVIGERQASRLCGPYKVRSLPYYDTSQIWDYSLDSFPYRVLFEPMTGYEPMCQMDHSVSIADVYAAIENRSIWSIATLENERNIERRAVRKISQEDSNTILNLFLREYREEAPSNSVKPIRLMNPPAPLIPMRTQIKDLGRYENSIKALTMDKLANRDPECERIFLDYVDFMNETFVAPTTRKLMDILVVSQIDEHTKRYYIIEAKPGKFKFDDLKQLMRYVDLFRQRPIFKASEDEISACGLAANFDESTMRFADLHNGLCPYDHIHLVQYEPNSQGTNARFLELPSALHTQSFIVFYTPAKWANKHPRTDVLEKASEWLPFYVHNRYVTRSLLEEVQDNAFIIQERNIHDGNLIRLYFIVISDSHFCDSHFKSFAEALYTKVVPKVFFDFRAIDPVLISPSYEPIVLSYISVCNDLGIRRPITVYEY